MYKKKPLQKQRLPEQLIKKGDNKRGRNPFFDTSIVAQFLFLSSIFSKKF